MTTVEELKAGLEQTRARLLRSIAGVTEEQFKRRPEATESEPRPWCIAEVLAHLLATEKLWAARIRLALVEDGAEVTPTPPGLDEEQARAGRQAPVPQLIHGLLAVHRELDGLVERALREDAFGREVVHPVRGRLSVRWMIEAYGVAHELEHAQQIEALRLVVGAKAVEA